MKHLLSVTAVGLALLVMAVPSGRATAGPPEKAGGDGPPVIMWEPSDPNAWSVGGQGQVLSIIQQMEARIRKIPLTGLVTDGMIAQVAAIYGDNGTMTGDDGTTYRGAREIAMYFRALSLCRKLADLRIEIKFVYAKEFTDRARDAGGKPEDIIHSLYFILSCSYRVNGQLVDPPSATLCAHSRTCECGTGK